MLHFNCAYLGQKFKLEENMSFTDYLLQQRMEKAKQLLSSTSLRIYEIAVEVGYKDIDWFYKSSNRIPVQVPMPTGDRKPIQHRYE